MTDGVGQEKYIYESGSMLFETRGRWNVGRLGCQPELQTATRGCNQSAEGAGSWVPSPMLIGRYHRLAGTGTRRQLRLAQSLAPPRLPKQFRWLHNQQYISTCLYSTYMAAEGCYQSSSRYWVVPGMVGMKGARSSRRAPRAATSSERVAKASQQSSGSWSQK